ncbi:nestin [Austrofundulus limnaeus]|uniref:Nestin n=1 Tax=Austrofundulus limnaeus TaxID=52670 RepID=A0A2I4CJ44_AUSLI|nr:PREDICTED: nestin [Austrofundulus limnaeus]
MEFQSAYKIFQPNHLGEEKQQMLNLNRRLETYLSRVKLLEEENELLANEIKALRHNNQGALAHRRGLEDELQRARLDVDAAWRERVLSEVEVEKMVEELHDLELQRQREAQAKAIATSKLEQSRKELQEEERAQMWLREKVNQLEQEMTLLIQTHEEDVAHLEATAIQSRAMVPPAQAHRTNQAPDLLRMGQEFSQRATRAWQEAAAAFQGQLARLEESLEEARSRLNHVHQEKHESQLKLQTLEKEMASAHDVRLHLERTVSQRREEHCQEIQHLQEHLEDLEMEKEKLAQQIAHLLQENRSLMQLKMSLGQEVTTYRALLDSEGLGADVSHKPRNISIRDAVLGPHGVKKNYQTQLSAGFKTTFPSSVLGTTRSTGTAAQIRSTKPATLNETPKFSSKPAKTDTKKSATLESCYPKSVEFEAAENLKSQKVYEKGTDAKPLSPSIEQGTPLDSLEVNNVVVEPAEEQIVTESVVSQKVESGLRNEPPLEDEASLCHVATPSFALCSFQEGEELSRVSDEPEQVAFQGESEKDVLQPQTQDSVSMKTQHADKEADHVQEETSESETEAMLEPTTESRPSSPESESESIETVFNLETDPSIDKNISNDPSVMIKQELRSVTVGTYGQEVEDKLYPDGEEMDTWDSVIERKVNVTTVDEMKNEGKKQHAEPEEDISAKEPEEEKNGAFQIDNKASSVMLPQVDEGQDTSDQEDASSPDKEEENDEEDSQNVCVSWRTELESDSYAQENTLADTRPLIRYKSDDTDANTQASHIDESESSEGEQEKKMDEAGMGTWSDSKSKTFGTMEDLCEEVEEETLDEDYNLGYTHVEDRDVSQHIGGEHVTAVTDRENAEEIVKNVSEEHLEKETEELTGADVHTDVDNDKELATEKLMANLSTDRYGVHFAEQQFREEILQMDDKCVEEVDEQAEHEKAKADDLTSCEPGISENHKHIISTLDQALENQMFSDPYTAMYPSNITAEEEVQQTMDKPEGEDEVEHNIHTIHDADPTEDQPIITDFINKSKLEHVEDTKNTEDPNPVVQVEADQKNLHDIPDAPETLPEETPKDDQEHVNEEDEHFHKFAPETAKCDVLDNQMFSDPYAAMFQSNTTAEEDVQHKDQQTTDKPEEEGEHNIHTVHDIDATEDHSGFTDSINKPDMEDKDTTILGDPNPVVLEDADQKNLHNIPAAQEVLPEETPKDGQEHVIEDSEDFYKFPAETVECEVLENQMFSDPYTTMYSSSLTAEEEVQHNNQQTTDKPEEEGEHNKHTVHDTDATEDHSSFTDFINRPEMEDKEDSKNPDDSNHVVLEDTDQKNLHDIPAAQEIPEALPEETPKDSQEHVNEDGEDFYKFPTETAECEVLENQDQNKQDQRNENMPDLAADDVVIHQEELVKGSSDSVPSQKDIFIMKDVTDSSLHNLFTSDVKKDFWVSSLESGATYKPDDACNKAAERTNQNQDFTDNQIWGNLENPNVVNGNSKSDVDSSKAMDAMKEQEQIHVEVKKVLVHSEESEVEAESWSSGEEPV